MAISAQGIPSFRNYFSETEVYLSRSTWQHHSSGIWRGQHVMCSARVRVVIPPPTRCWLPLCLLHRCVALDDAATSLVFKIYVVDICTIFARDGRGLGIVCARRQRFWVWYAHASRELVSIRVSLKNNMVHRSQQFHFFQLHNSFWSNLTCPYILPKTTFFCYCCVWSDHLPHGSFSKQWP